MSQVIHRKHKIRRGWLLAAAVPILPSVINTGTVLAATNTSENFTFQVVVSETPVLSIALDNALLSLNLTPGMTSSVFGSDDVAVTVGTSNSAGYNLTMTASSSSLTSGDNSINSLIPDSTNYPNGYDESSFTVNSWGFKRDTGLYAGENYRPVTTDETLIHSYSRAIEANTSDTNSTSSVTFAAKINNQQAAGTYQTSLTFKATANVITSNCAPGAICYNGNEPTGATTMANQTTDDSGNVIADGSAVTLRASNYSKSNYGFFGWMTTPSPEQSTVYYGPNETITADAFTVADGLQLYAYWIPASTRYTMQTFTSGVCSNELTAAIYNSSTGKMSASSNSFIALKDERDNNVYAVARLADGQCWMIENLRFADTPFNVNNTHNPALPLTQSDGTSTANQLSATSSDWCTANNAACHDKSMLNTTATTNTVAESTGNSASDGYSANIYSYGNYYNWYSATAGNGKNATVNGETLAQNMSTVGDICPTNWRLPMGGAFPNTTMQDANGKTGTEATDNRTNSDYYKLFYGMLGQVPNVVHASYSYYTYYGDVATANDYQAASTIGTAASQLARKYPNNFIYSGYWYGSSASYRGALGYYWSSTAYNTNYAYLLGFGSAYLSPGTDRNYKRYGFSVRCLAGV